MTNPSELFTPFLSTTYNLPKEEDRLNTFLLDRFSGFADVINDKKIGVITQQTENFNGERWWYKNSQVNRNGYQTIAYIPSFPNTGTLVLTLSSIPTFPIVNINPEFVVTQLYGSASKSNSAIGSGDGDYFSFMAKGDTRISFTMSDTTLTITTTIDMSAYSGFIVIHYLRNGL